jgi:predicted phosphoribosyltransferase
MAESQSQQETLDSRLGQILLRRGLLSPSKLEAALEAHARTGEKLGETLLQSGDISEEDLRAALREQLQNARLGQILLRIGAVDPTSLQAALDEQTKTGQLLGEILMAHGACTPEAVDWALSQQNLERRVGQVLLNRKLATPQQIEHGFEVLATQPDRLLSEIMVELGYLTAEQLHMTLRFHLQELRLGQILVKQGVLSEEQLSFALSHQTVTGGLLGGSLLALGLCTNEQIARALAEQLSLSV